MYVYSLILIDSLLRIENILLISALRNCTPFFSSLFRFTDRNKTTTVPTPQWSLKVNTGMTTRELMYLIWGVASFSWSMLTFFRHVLDFQILLLRYIAEHRKDDKTSIDTRQTVDQRDHHRISVNVYSETNRYQNDVKMAKSSRKQVCLFTPAENISTEFLIYIKTFI